MTRKLKIQFYRDKKREWRWRIRHPNGRITSCSGGDGYKKTTEAVKGFNSNYWPDPVVIYIPRLKSMSVLQWASERYTVEVIR